MEEQYIDPHLLNGLNTQNNSDNVSADLGLDGFFDNGESDEMKRNRDNVFGILDEAEAPGGGISEEQYRERFEKDCVEAFGYVPKRAPNGVFIPLKPNALEAQMLKRRYNALGTALIMFLVFSSVVPMILVYAGVFGMYVANPGLQSSDIDILYNNVINSTGAYMLINAGTVLVSLLFAAIIGCSMVKISPSKFFAAPKIGVKQTLAYASVGFFLQLIASYITAFFSYLASLGGFELATADFSTNRDAFATIVICTYTIVIAPIIEEFFFRGFVLNNISKISRRFAMFVSAFLFALYHMNIPQFITAFLFGLLLSYVTLKADSIVPAIIIHAINNFISMAITILYEYNESVADIVSIVSFYGLALIGLIVLIIKQKKEALPEQIQHQKARCLPLALKTVSLDIAVILMIAMTALVMFE